MKVIKVDRNGDTLHILYMPVSGVPDGNLNKMKNLKLATSFFIAQRFTYDYS